MISETSKHRDKVVKYCQGTGVDCGSAGDPITPTAIQIELANNYCPFLGSTYPPHIRGDATNLQQWFKDGCLDYVFSSHLIEDFDAQEQERIIRDWGRCLKLGGYLVLLAPEKGRWAQALANGQPPNLAHKNEPSIGEFSELVNRIGWFKVLEDRFCDDADYGLMFVAQRKA